MSAETELQVRFTLGKISNQGLPLPLLKAKSLLGEGNMYGYMVTVDSHLMLKNHHQSADFSSMRGGGSDSRGCDWMFDSDSHVHVS